MELIPILSLIILVATISTFILAVGAYILYKVRERKGIAEKAPQPAAIPAELIAPAPLQAEQRVAAQERKTFEVVQPPQYGYEYQRAAPYEQEESKGPELRPTFVGGAPRQYQGSEYQRRTDEQVSGSVAERYSPKRKFVRYTGEGYEEPVKQEKKQEENLRWR
ncbi:hypothetical protein [Rosettibacter firmus]|uniref:hypothetical protein n=1 Tax=Rosettibacter firmus TaxID=3111522 RepID=UPI00336BF4D9